jgi:hypothetical protein
MNRESVNECILSRTNCLVAWQHSADIPNSSAIVKDSPVAFSPDGKLVASAS